MTVYIYKEKVLTYKPVYSGERGGAPAGGGRQGWRGRGGEGGTGDIPGNLDRYVDVDIDR